MQKYIDLSDLHIGNPKVPANLLYQHLVTYLYPLLNDELDILFIPGDFFDTLLNFNHSYGKCADRIIHELIALAKEHKFFIRVLRGTFSHDRKQNNFFIIGDEDNHPLLNGEPLILVYDGVGLECNQTLGINILYLPDDLPYGDKLEVGRELMRDAQLEKVDLMINHGYFAHMLPRALIDKLPHGTLREQDIRPLVKGCVLTGHVHTNMIYKNIISAGSFERMVHGEEEDKGFYVIYYEPKSGKVKTEFVINQDALIFKSINITGNSIEEATDAFMRLVEPLIQKRKADEPIYVRVIGDNTIVNHALVEYARNTYDKVITSTLSTKRTNEEVANVQVSVQELPLITETSLPALIMDYSLEHNIALTEEDIREVLDATADTCR